MITRKLEPQWGLNEDGKSIGNLGSFKVKMENPDKAGIDTMLAKSFDAFSEMVGGQLHIKFGTAVAKAAVMKQVEVDMPKEKDEKNAAYLERTYDHAREIAKDIFGNDEFVMDYVGAFVQWVDESYNKRGATGDQIVKLIRSKWATSTNEKRAAFLAKFGLDKSLLAGVTEDIVNAYQASGSLL